MSEYAVLIPYVTTEQGQALLFEVRSEKVKQPGEICFPGGRMEPGETPEQTAVREACEELGLLPEQIEIRSGLEPEIMGDGRIVYPFFAKLDINGTSELILSEVEVSEVFLIPSEWFTDNHSSYYDLSITQDEEMPARLVRYLSSYSKYRKTGETYYWEYEGHGIWGLTARILTRITKKWESGNYSVDLTKIIDTLK